MSAAVRWPRAVIISALAGVAVCASSRTALSHPVPFSYVDVRLESGRVEASVVAHIINVGSDLKVSATDSLLDSAVVAERRQTLIDLFDRHLTVFADNRRLKGDWRQIDVLVDQQALKLSVSYPLATAPGAVRVRSTLFAYDPEHRTFVNIYDGAELRDQAILDTTREEVVHFSGAGGACWPSRSGSFRSGFAILPSVLITSCF